MNKTITIHEENAKFHVEPSWNGQHATFRILTNHSTDLLTEEEANRLADNLIAAFLELDEIRRTHNERPNYTSPLDGGNGSY